MQLHIIVLRKITNIRFDFGTSLAKIEKWKYFYPTTAHTLIATSNYRKSLLGIPKVIRKKVIAYIKSFPKRNSLFKNIGPYSVIKKSINKLNILENDR